MSDEGGRRLHRVVSTLTLILLAVLLAGCMRVGFGPLGGGEADSGANAPVDPGWADQGRPAVAPDLAPAGSDGAPVLALDRDNDTCASPLVVDVEDAATQPKTILVDFTGASSDHASERCGGLPELVLRLINTPDQGQLQQSCAGGGSIRTYTPLNGGCSGLPVGATSSFTCHLNDKSSLMVPKGSGHVLVCRDPSSPLATLVITTL